MSPVFDSPINSNDQSLDRVLAAGLPVALVMLDGALPAALDQSLQRLARQYAGSLLVVKVQARENPKAAALYKTSRLPALVTLRSGQVLTKAENPSPADLEKHTAFLLGKGPRPEPPAAPHPAPAGAANASSAPGRPQEVTDATFDREVMGSALPVVVDFWAPWCGPCRMTDPILVKLAAEWAGKVKIAKVNVDENPQIAGRYDVRSIPTMMVVKNGQVATRWAGALPEPALRSRLSSFVQV